jgi:hypothetical protein
MHKSCGDIFGPQIVSRAPNQFRDYGGGFSILCFILVGLHDHCPEKELFDLLLGI